MLNVPRGHTCFFFNSCVNYWIIFFQNTWVIIPVDVCHLRIKRVLHVYMCVVRLDINYTSNKEGMMLGFTLSHEWRVISFLMNKTMGKRIKQTKIVFKDLVFNLCRLAKIFMNILTDYSQQSRQEIQIVCHFC